MNSAIIGESLLKIEAFANYNFINWLIFSTLLIKAFDNLAALLERKNRNRQRRLVVFIDELPCFDTKRSGFLHALDLFWK